MGDMSYSHQYNQEGSVAKGENPELIKADEFFQKNLQED
jgi:hypothetical protein